VEQQVVDFETASVSEYKFTKKDYLSTIRRSVVMDNFLYFFLFSLISVYLLSQGVTPWVAVSIPLVLRIARLITSSSSLCLKISLKISYKKIYMWFIFLQTTLGVLLLNMRSPFTIIPITILCGIINGVCKMSVTALNTQNPRFESHCLITWERSIVIGSLLGSLFGQLVFDIGYVPYLIIFIAIGIFSLTFNISMKDIRVANNTASDTDANAAFDTKLSPYEKRKIFVCSSIYAIFISMWTMADGIWSEIAPLISSRLGYANALLQGVELLTLIFFSGKMLAKLKSSHNLVLVAFIFAFIDCLCVFMMCKFRTELCLFIIYGISGVGTALGDPIWASIVSSMSQNNRAKYVKIMHLYYLYSTGFALLSIVLCSVFVSYAIDSMKYYAFVLLVIIVFVYIIFELLCKKYYKRSI